MKWAFDHDYTGVPEEGYFRLGHEARFENLGYFAIAIVAVQNYMDGELMDWAAYMGGSADAKERDVCNAAAQHGNKLSQEDTRHYFKGKHFPQSKWRR